MTRMMMEGSRSRAVITVMKLMLLVMLLLQAGQIKATSFQSCYAPCFILCAITPETTLGSCALQCLKQCIVPPSPVDHFHYYCHLGCSSSLCSSLSTIDKPDGEAVDGCVRSCSDKCSKYHV